MDPNLERPYYQDTGRRPFLFGEHETCVVHPELAGDLEDPDYNNEHYSLHWEDCEFENE